MEVQVGPHTSENMSSKGALDELDDIGYGS
jgi:hypothetical protein